MKTLFVAAFLLAGTSPVAACSMSDGTITDYLQCQRGRNVYYEQLENIRRMNEEIERSRRQGKDYLPYGY